MYTAAAVIATEEQMPKLSKLVTLWETKSKFFEEEVLEKMRDFKESAAKYRWATGHLRAVGPFDIFFIDPDPTLAFEMQF